MAYLVCDCGERISDSTDFISYKARFVADQDYFDFCDEIENKGFTEQNGVLTKYFQEIFQCSACRNVIFLTAEGRFDFQPLNREKSSQILRSFLGEKWKGMMSANFYNGKGEIHWQTNIDSGFQQNLSMRKLKEIYFEKFEKLKKLDVLRSSFLRIDGDIVHSFDEE